MTAGAAVARRILDGEAADLVLHHLDIVIVCQDQVGEQQERWESYSSLEDQVHVKPCVTESEGG